MTDTDDLWDWRQRIADLYHDVRANQHAPTAWRHWCATRAAMFRTHPQSPVEAPARATFDGPMMYSYDPALRLDVRLVAAVPERLSLASGADGDTRMHAFARTDGLRERLDGELTLYWIEGYGGGVFLPFAVADATNGEETYGGGRYLLDTIKGADLGVVRPNGTLTLDFNFAYAPSCAYSPRYVCPLAPPANRLSGAVRGGERFRA